jgi:cytochrome c-type biogenesis protein CcmH
MTLFLLCAAALVIISLALLLPPLLRSRRYAAPSERAANVSVYRDQVAELERDQSAGTLSPEQYAQARAELEARLLDDVKAASADSPASRKWPGRIAAAVILVAVPVVAGSLYWHLGSPQALLAKGNHPIDPANMTVEQFQAMTSKLAARMRQQPNDVVGWTMLGRAYKALERYPDAAQALARANKLQPENAEILVEYAEALGLAKGGDLSGEPAHLIERALKLAPDDPKALTLAGTAAFSNGDYKQAIAYWQRLAAKLPPSSEMGQAIASGIAEAKARQQAKTAGGAPVTSKTAKAVSGVVRLAPSLQGEAQPQDTVFIFARAAEGPKMPLAVAKVQVKDLPFTFKLDDSMAMRPGLELSGFPRVVVVARVSKSGAPMPAAGDLEGASGEIVPGATNVAVLIDKKVP